MLPFHYATCRSVPLLCHGTPGPGTQESAAGLYTRLLLLMIVRWCNLFIRVLPRAAHTRGACLVSRYTAACCRQQRLSVCDSKHCFPFALQAAVLLRTIISVYLTRVLLVQLRRPQVTSFVADFVGPRVFLTNGGASADSCHVRPFSMATYQQ